MQNNTLVFLLALGLVALVVLAFDWARKDFKAWVALGPAGLPHTLLGWLAMTALRPLKRDGRLGQALEPELHGADDHAYLGTLMRRVGQRPQVPIYPIPQRQETDLPTPTVMQRLWELFERHVGQRPSMLTWRTSRFERHNRAMVLRHPECGWACAARWGGEVAHIHPSDGSMHMILSPSDAARVIEQGWGELHSLSGRLGLLPASYTFVYAPRNAQDLQVVEAILLAAIGHMSGQVAQAGQRVVGSA
jgi:Family of unknown function (DUF5519)